MVQGSNVEGLVPIKVVLTPRNGDSLEYNADIDMTATNVASVTVPVGFPVNQAVQVDAWTR